MSKTQKVENVPVFKGGTNSPRQLMIQGGKIVTLDGKEAAIDFPDGTPVNVVERDGFNQTRDLANLMRWWGA